MTADAGVLGVRHLFGYGVHPRCPQGAEPAGESGLWKGSAVPGVRQVWRGQLDMVRSEARSMANSGKV